MMIDKACPVCDYKGDFNEMAPDLNIDRALFIFECPKCHSVFGDKYKLRFDKTEVYHKGREAEDD